jgi:predicted NUDIX family NTP pyrophosphohydrolase
MRNKSFTMEWPPHSEKQRTYLEAGWNTWFVREEAGGKISKGLRALLTELQQRLSDHC